MKNLVPVLPLLVAAIGSSLPPPDALGGFVRVPGGVECCKRRVVPENALSLETRDSEQKTVLNRIIGS